MKNKEKTSFVDDNLKQKALLVIDKVMQKFGVNFDMKTDPEIIQDVLEEMKLDDFKTEYDPIKLFLEKTIAEPQDLKLMFQNIKQGLMNKHPAIIEFLEIAIAKNWLSQSEHVTKSVHVAFIQEALTAAMINNQNFYSEIRKHLLLKRKWYGIQINSAFNTFWKIWLKTRSFFDAIKVVSVDSPITYYKLQREARGIPLSQDYVKKLYKEGKINYIEYRIMLASSKKGKNHYLNWLSFNIYEAGIAEYKKGFEENSMSAHTLSQILEKQAKKDFLMQKFETGNAFPGLNSNSFYNSLIDNKNIYVVNIFEQDWVSLYESWNLAFILSELDDLHILFPKLFIPSVINATDKNYMASRIITLWLSINTLLFKEFDQDKKVLGPKNKKEMAKVWGEINKKYALAFIEKDSEIDFNDLNKSFKKTFSFPYFKLFKRVFSNF